MIRPRDKKAFLVVFSEEQLGGIKKLAERLDMSTSAFIRLSCLRNQEVFEHLHSQAVRQRFRASLQSEP